MAWIELHQSLWTHRKTVILSAYLDINETYAAAHLARFWTWALDNAQDGDLTGLPDKVIAFGAGWLGDANVFVTSLIDSGWLDDSGDGLIIHDWDDYAGRLIEKRVANKERMRNARANKSTRAAPVQRTNETRDETDVARAGATVPYPTVPNQTEPKDTTTTTQGEESPGSEIAPKPETIDSTSSSQAFNVISEAYCELHAIGSWQFKSTDVTSISAISSEVPCEFAIAVMRGVFEEKQKREKSRFKKPSSFTYYAGAIREAYAADQARKEAQEHGLPAAEPSSGGSRYQRSGFSRKPKLDVIQPSSSPDEHLSVDELDELRKLAFKLDGKVGVTTGAE
ncbi:hypothetical protein ACFOLF_12365 [Paenibacillus sepulcri]|uniref:DUF1376 domain-containing protein n=1 Tax=Paenibacillus sepulcri TaxID=359917 RepID=A0ABS7BYZ0_9BACL|nr:hypothetical protein [Paenibacillus sepulcri]